MKQQMLQYTPVKVDDDSSESNESTNEFDTPFKKKEDFSETNESNNNSNKTSSNDLIEIDDENEDDELDFITDLDLMKYMQSLNDSTPVELMNNTKSFNDTSPENSHPKRNSENEHPEDEHPKPIVRDNIHASQLINNFDMDETKHLDDFELNFIHDHQDLNDDDISTSNSEYNARRSSSSHSSHDNTKSGQSTSSHDSNTRSRQSSVVHNELKKKIKDQKIIDILQNIKNYDPNELLQDLSKPIQLPIGVTYRKRKQKLKKSTKTPDKQHQQRLLKNPFLFHNKTIMPKKQEKKKRHKQKTNYQ